MIEHLIPRNRLIVNIRWQNGYMRDWFGNHRGHRVRKTEIIGMGLYAETY